ncbi:MAG: hypothetical protein ACTSQP_08140 [Promethearchaeota archaeon]
MPRYITSKDRYLINRSKSLIDSLEILAITSAFLFGLFTSILFSIILTSDINNLMDIILGYIYAINWLFFLAFFLSTITLFRIKWKLSYFPEEYIEKLLENESQLTKKDLNFIKYLKRIEFYILLSYILIFFGISLNIPMFIFILGFIKHLDLVFELMCNLFIIIGISLLIYIVPKIITKIIKKS